MGATAGLPGSGGGWKHPTGIRGGSCAAQQALVHSCRAAVGSCARARRASLDPSPQTLLCARTTTGGRPRVSCGVQRRGEYPAPPLSTAFHRSSAQGRLEGNTLKLDLLTSGGDLDSSPPRGPRIRPGAREILERGQRGVGDVLLQLRGISLGSGVSPKSKSLQTGY